LFPLYIQKIRQGERRGGWRGKEERERKRETHTQREREGGGERDRGVSRWGGRG